MSSKIESVSGRRVEVGMGNGAVGVCLSSPGLPSSACPVEVGTGH